MYNDFLDNSSYVIYYKIYKNVGYNMTMSRSWKAFIV